MKTQEENEVSNPDGNCDKYAAISLNTLISACVPLMNIYSSLSQLSQTMLN